MTSGSKRVQLVAKRAIDLAGGLTLMGVLLIPAVLIAVLICVDSPGLPFLVQRRVGKEGRLFSMYKFRTMLPDADSRISDVRASNQQSGPLFKMRNDPRMTRVGRWLRKLSIDELPQLVNVVRGEMSLVGPRPALPREVREYSQRDRRRLLAQPGLTGLWQVSGRSTLGFQEMVELDLQYMENWSIARDVQILLRTLPAVISTRGAY